MSLSCLFTAPSLLRCARLFRFHLLFVCWLAGWLLRVLVCGCEWLRRVCVLCKVMPYISMRPSISVVVVSFWFVFSLALNFISVLVSVRFLGILSYKTGYSSRRDSFTFHRQATPFLSKYLCYYTCLCTEIEYSKTYISNVVIANRLLGSVRVSVFRFVRAYTACSLF